MIRIGRFSSVILISLLVCLLSFASQAFCEVQKRAPASPAKRGERGAGPRTIQLPAPALTGSVSVEDAINKRRSIRQFSDKLLNFGQIGQLCWAGQGITDKERNLRAAPSAGALYPIELYCVTPVGTFVYRPEEHSLEQTHQADLREQLASAAGGQAAVSEAACSIVIAGSVKKLTAKYGNKATKFMLIEAGCVAENIQLESVAMGLASLPVGAFETKSVAKVFQMKNELEPLLIVCVGYPLRQSGKAQPAGENELNIKRAVLIVPGADFRDEELTETRRILNEASIVTTVASSKIGPLKGTSGGLVASELTLDRVPVDDFDVVIFIGGPGAEEYFNNPAAIDIARQAADKRKVLAAIDTAPTILANAGVLRDLRATGFLTQREAIQKGGAKYTGAQVEREGLIITASGPLAVVPFARTIVGTLREIEQRTGKSP